MQLGGGRTDKQMDSQRLYVAELSMAECAASSGAVDQRCVEVYGEKCSDNSTLR
jgi:hypothetical protein